MRDIDNYFLQHPEPVRACLQFLRGHIVSLDTHITEAWKYRMPFYCYKERMFCYLWTDKKSCWPYIGIVEGKNILHPDLIAGKRTRMKILLLDPDTDLPIRKINQVLKEVLELYK
jgi:hypothetical protein